MIGGSRVVATTPHGELTVDEIAAMQPGLATLMDLLARRYWTMYYAAHGGNWELADYEHRESMKLLATMQKVRPKYADDLRTFEQEIFRPLGVALTNRDIGAFEAVYHEGIRASDRYHDKWQKAYIRFRLPNRPPDFLDVGDGA